MVPMGQSSDSPHLANERIRRTNLIKGKVRSLTLAPGRSQTPHQDARAYEGACTPPCSAYRMRICLPVPGRGRGRLGAGTGHAMLSLACLSCFLEACLYVVMLMPAGGDAAGCPFLRRVCKLGAHSVQTV